MTKLGKLSKISVQLAILCLLLSHDPSSKLVCGQLEAVGAVLSVVPVTSILATAGLVGVKLAALSRLLDLLGYDRAYLAQGGSGTAASPIGLQTKYAYMFPYVPGLNITIQGDDSIGMQEAALKNQAKVNGAAPKRKTYPAMGLPGDYENQQHPFRGSEALQRIFKDAGLQVHLPTAQQKQQLQQQFNLPPQEQTHTDHTSMPHNNDNNNKNDQNAQQPQQPSTLSILNQPVAQQTHLFHAVPQNLVPHHATNPMAQNDPTDGNHNRDQQRAQLASGQLSSSSQGQGPATGQQQPESKAVADAAAQPS